jgi:asparaginyl-tRNA synthetase
LRRWFDENGFESFAAPLLTPCPLYEDETAVQVHLQKQDIFLTQCAGFYLEAAAHAFEKVYNIGPSFRAAESKSPRHLVEYWHVKAELLWGNLDDMMAICEQLLFAVAGEMEQTIQSTSMITQTKPCLDALKTPYGRVAYKDAVEQLQKAGCKISFGQAINGEDQTRLARNFDRPFWVVCNPRTVEPFPYVVDSADPRLMRTADLIATGDGGELLGAAEKISNIQQLDERMKEKGRENDRRYQFVREVHTMGCVPHIAFGMGFERMIRWLLGLPHVRDAIPFPRLVGRRFYP